MAGDQFERVIMKPELIIGSDRMELYDFLGRRKERFYLQNRNWLKFCVAITFCHFLLVSVPTMFSHYFGDEVSSVSKGLGAQERQRR
mmetsp:Transcript_33620/g.24645  ORF Transcript_33620/g.24645 Transcript_33620/m.24645 type:complete len:87 (-) Transcript_33620:38-298(-)